MDNITPHGDNIQPLVDSLHGFMGELIAYYGEDEGVRVFNSVCDCVPVELSRRFIAAMLTGDIYNIRVRGLHPSVDAFGQIRGYDKINRIKSVRMISGLGLREAKEFVENLENAPGILVRRKEVPYSLAISQLHDTGMIV